ncbi:threonine-phosphate decarboxylase CobD [Natronobiforma cellulositropha]|uniref:threonine-phosphate decarboxylase CobD n=1 Tax=Natronobiforma cellulositropha TaxID=1679076 RepID=UPI0021D5B628|nr:threonine-phosphate decarboxylase CobD [Natronobiforma cellulositropha]
MNREAVGRTERVPHGGESDPAVLDFSANVNPRTPPGVEAVYREALERSRRYPDDEYREYREAAGAYVGCSPEEVIPTPGGLAAIRLAIETTVEAGDTVLVPYPSFGEYAREVRLQGATPVFVRHDDILECEPAGHALAVVCTPNNPTGECAPAAKLRRYAARCREAGTTLLVDEAFLGFTDEPTLAGEDGVIVARSLTKLFGLPGLRAGFAVASGDQREALERARPAWNLGTPAAMVGTHCLRQEAFVRETRTTVARERARLRGALERRFDVSPSDAPFLLCELTAADPLADERAPVAALCASAREAGVALRDARTFRGLDSHVRVAVKDRAANGRLLEVLVGE